MPKYQLAYLRDVAMEYLPETSAAREKSAGSIQAFHDELWGISVCGLPTSTAIQLAAEDLLRHVMECFAPESTNLRKFGTVDEYQSAMREISNAVKVLAELTGKEISFDCEVGSGETKKVGTNKKAWDDVRLRALMDESNQVGVTQESLAKKYGVKRQRIGSLLKDAKEKFRLGNAVGYGQLLNPRAIKGKF